MKLNNGNLSLNREWLLIIILAMVKLLIHLLTFDNYELHRDAYLYYAQGEHLAWGFVAVPPSIGFFSWLFTGIFGDTVFALRLVPAIVGAINVLIIGAMVKELGGKALAILIACLAYLAGFAYLHVNTLFQPVSFNHLYWLLSGYLLLLLVRRKDTRIWILIGIVFGIAFLNKYSIVFFYAALGIAMLISRHRKLLWSKHFLIGAVAGLLIILPNLIWQYNHNWPVLHHMEELRRTQLVHVSYTDFLLDQLIMNAQALPLWLGALGILLFHPKERNYRVFGLVFLGVILLLLLGSGKAYYTLGLYPIYFAFGAYYLEKYFRGRSYKFAVTIVVAFLLTGIAGGLYMDGIPFLKPEQVAREKAFRWEDGQMHDIPQDLSDMRGWNTIAGEVIKIYEELSPKEQQNCAIYCELYAQAGALMFHGKSHGLPKPMCFTGSFTFWAPDSLSQSHVIAVIENARAPETDSLMKLYFENYELSATIDDPWFRENGTGIFLGENPTPQLESDYKQWAEEAKALYRKRP
ncbi:MAG: glycosyltransferase family 39 protein [Bacteroidales bacterium]|nr:glycosyltransferase family 39 protein [Bacteroidales bacterium]